MSRTIELGRAVLGSPTSNQELWLTTLITISLTQDATYLQQLRAGPCLELLASGGLWVGRGHGMHIDLEITMREEALPPHQMQDLADAILQAPIWNQLMLEPTLPLNAAVEPGRIQLDIIHATTGPQEEPKRHRLFQDVPKADTQPPEGVVSVCLQSVCLTIDILETSPRRKFTAKRSDKSSSERRISNTHAQDDLQNQVTGKPTTSRKRKRPGAETNFMMQQALDNKVGGPTESTDRSPADLFSSRRHLHDMVDGSLRLSICGVLPKAASVSKVKASTFRFGLADVAPSIWRNGYLTALSQRAHLLPTITRSLHQMGYEKAASLSLRDKVMKLSASSHKGTRCDEHEPEPNTDGNDAQPKGSITSRLWVHSQMSLLNKPVTSIQTCIASETTAVAGILDSDDMLAEEEQMWSTDMPSTCSDKTGLNDSSQVPVDDPLFCLTGSTSPAYMYAQRVQQSSQRFGHADLNDGPWEAEDDLLLDPHTHSTMLLVESSNDRKSTTPSSATENPEPRLSTLAQQTVMQQVERTFGIIEPAFSSSSPVTSSVMSSARILSDKAPLIEEFGGHNTDCGNDMLLAF